MKTTAMLYGPGGAQRVTVLTTPPNMKVDGEPATRVKTRDGQVGMVKSSLLSDFRETEDV
jgi:hypothetical protein